MTNWSSFDPLIITDVLAQLSLLIAGGYYLQRKWTSEKWVGVGCLAVYLLFRTVGD